MITYFKNLKWIQILSIWLWQKNTCLCMYPSQQASRWETILEQMQKTTFSQVLVSTYLCLCSKICCCYDSESQKYKFSNKGLNKRALEDSGDDPMAKYRQVLDEAVNLKSTIRGFKTINHSVAT